MDIQKEFERLVRLEARDRAEEQEQCKERYENLIEQIKWMVEEGRRLQHSSLEDNLPIGAVEAEGFVRFGVEILGWIEEQ